MPDPFAELTARLFDDSEHEPDSAHDPVTGNRVPSEGTNPTTDPGADLREWVDRLLNPPPPGQRR